MSSPSVSDQGKQSPTSNGDGESSQDSTMDVKVKDEPADAGYEQAPSSENHSNSNSRASSPPPSSVQREVASPSRDPDCPSSPAQASPQQVPNNDGFTGPSIRSHLQSTNTGKKVDSVQNIVEGLLKKNATLLAMSDAEGLKPNSRRNKGSDSIKRGETLGQSTVFPVSMVSQARLVASQDSVDKKRNDLNKSRFLRPKSPTRKCESILRDDTQLTYALMEAGVGDEEVEKLFRVQHHELVCAVSVKSVITDRERKVVATLDNSYYWCNFCSFSSTNKELLIQHIMDHRFRCSHCPYESFCRSDIIRHMAASHSEFASSADPLLYCTFLSDYLRVKSRSENLEKKLPCTDPDDDVNDLDKDEMQAALLKSEKRKQEDNGDAYDVPQKKARLEDGVKSSESSDRQGKSRKSQNPRRHPQPSESDYDTFEMEVEEINDYIENGGEYGTDKMKVMYPSRMSEEPTEQVKPSPMVSRMQVLPSLQDGGKQGFTTTHISSPATPRQPQGRPARTACPFNKTRRTASSSSLYWSCGYCDFQSSSQAEIKEHSNRNHPGNPHRFNKIVPEQSEVVLGEETNVDDDISDIDEDEDVTTSIDGNPANVFSKAVNSVCSERSDEKCGSVLSDSYCLNESSARFDEGLNALQEQQLKIYPQTSQSESKNKNEGGADRSVSLKSQGEWVKIQQNTLGLSESRTNVSAKDNSSPTLIERVVELCALEVDTSENDDVSNSSQILTAESFITRSSESLSSPSLKLTFKTIGEITTCSMKADKNLSCDDNAATLLSGSSKRADDTASKKEDDLESFLIDSSEDSDFDIGSNPRSTALSVSCVSELFENSLNSPCKETDITLGVVEEEMADLGGEIDRESQPAPIFNKSIVNLSPLPIQVPDRLSDKVALTCVPVRSAAVKAMTKMKEEAVGDDSQLGHTGVSCSKKQPVKAKQCHEKLSQAQSQSIPEEQPLPGNPSRNVVKSMYSCHHCTKMMAVILPRIKSHLISHHSGQPPVVTTDVRLRLNGKKKRKLYVCLFPSCKKLFKSALDLDNHKNENHNSSLSARPKERKTMNSLSTSSVSSITQVLPPPVSISDCCVKLHHLDMTKLNKYCSDTVESVEIEVNRYECLYCTESVSCNTLSEIKQHYFSEHPSQLLVLRDVEARKSQLPSRIYVCDDTGCDFKSSCRADILAHAQCHSINSTCVYECPSCGWYSSSYRVAEEHVQDVHADEENISLVRMQLTIDDNGQTSKKILR